MKKKAYQAPQLKVVQVQQMQIICESTLECKSQNESYEEVDVETTNGWF